MSDIRRGLPQLKDDLEPCSVGVCGSPSVLLSALGLSVKSSKRTPRSGKFSVSAAHAVVPYSFNTMTASLPSINTLPSLSAEERANALDLLFEPCTALHTLSVELLANTTFASYNDLVASVGAQLTELSESSSTSDTKWLESILGSHPRLGAKKVDSAQSQAEQAQLKGSEEESQKLKELNEEYEKTYPGLRYVVFVNGRSRPVIMEDMRKRIARGNMASERADAIRVRCTTSKCGFVNAHVFDIGHV